MSLVCVMFRGGRTAGCVAGLGGWLMLRSVGVGGVCACVGVEWRRVMRVVARYCCLSLVACCPPMRPVAAALFLRRCVLLCAAVFCGGHVPLSSAVLFACCLCDGFFCGMLSACFLERERERELERDRVTEMK